MDKGGTRWIKVEQDGSEWVKMDQSESSEIKIDYSFKINPVGLRPLRRSIE